MNIGQLRETYRGPVVAGVALALSFVSLIRNRAAGTPARGELASSTESPALVK